MVTKIAHPASALGIPIHYIKSRHRRTVPHGASVAQDDKITPPAIPVSPSNSTDLLQEYAPSPFPCRSCRDNLTKGRGNVASWKAKLQL